MTFREIAAQIKKLPRVQLLSRKQNERRRFLRSLVVGGLLLALQPLAWWPVARRWRSRLRPPGALAEKNFLSACIKCGQCVQVCPVQAISLADLEEGFGHGVPFIEPRRQACDFSCDAISCVLACPTGALHHAVNEKTKVRMGLARFARPDACLARQGKSFHGIARGATFEGRLRYEEVDRWTPQEVRIHEYAREVCDLCVLECPIGETALRMESLENGYSDGESSTRKRQTPVVGEGCVGCGVCQMICPVEPECFVIEERAVWQTVPYGEEVEDASEASQPKRDEMTEKSEQEEDGADE